MVRIRYVPERGDIVWVTFDPSRGREQKGRRPAYVLTPRKYNEKTGLMIACPLTTHVKGYPAEVVIVGKKVKGAFLADQIQARDWTDRGMKFIERAPRKIHSAILERLLALIA